MSRNQRVKSRPRYFSALKCQTLNFFVAPWSRFRFSFGVSKSWIFIKYWLPTLLWMSVIFTASADPRSAQHTSWFFVPLVHWLLPHLSDREVDSLHHLFRKFGHFTGYACFGLLVRRTLCFGLKTGFPPWSGRMVASIIAAVFLYASSDEFHQSFVPTRTPLFSDVLIDTAGGTTGLLLLWLWQRSRRKPQPA